MKTKLNEMKHSLLTDEELRVKVAELCGWTHMRYVMGTLWGYHGVNPNWSAGCKGDTTDVPDYCHDLNVCHEMEKLLPKKLVVPYVAAVTVIMFRQDKPVERSFQLFATARQRCEAFVAVLKGKKK